MKIFLVCCRDRGGDSSSRDEKSRFFLASVRSHARPRLFGVVPFGPSSKQLTLRLFLSLSHTRAQKLLKSKSSRGNFDVESRGGGGGGGRNSFAVLNEELRRDALVNSVSNADTLSETLERAHTTASETDDAGETILKSLSQQKHRLLSARAAAASMERDMESSERKLRRMGYEKCIQRWMWHVVALCVVAALGTFAYFKITADAHRKNGRHLSDYKIIDRDDETGKFV